MVEEIAVKKHQMQKAVLYIVHLSVSCWIITESSRRVLLDCDPRNHAARHVYEKLGFTPTGVISHGSDEMEFVLIKE